jgi:hypothetical protein
MSSGGLQEVKFFSLRTFKGLAQQDQRRSVIGNLTCILIHQPAK